MLAVVKANAYGHGLIGVAEALAEDAQLFGVANLEEAIALRRRASASNHHSWSGSLPKKDRPLSSADLFRQFPTFEEADEFNVSHAKDARSQSISRSTPAWGAWGVPEGEALEIFKKVAALPKIDIHSVSTHMPVSNEDAEYTRDRAGAIWQDSLGKYAPKFPAITKRTCCKVPVTLAFADPTFDIVRAGIILYGISPLPEFQKILKPVMTWKTRIGLIRDMPKGSSISYGRTFITPGKMRVATLTAGYADGYPRHLSNRDAAVLVRGQRCALLGRVTMDLMMIDVSKIDNVQVGDEVVLMGQQGDRGNFVRGIGGAKPARSLGKSRRALAAASGGVC